MQVLVLHRHLKSPKSLIWSWSSACQWPDPDSWWNKGMVVFFSVPQFTIQKMRSSLKGLFGNLKKKTHRKGIRIWFVVFLLHAKSKCFLTRTGSGRRGGTLPLAGSHSSRNGKGHLDMNCKGLVSDGRGQLVWDSPAAIWGHPLPILAHRLSKLGPMFPP